MVGLIGWWSRWTHLRVISYTLIFTHVSPFHTANRRPGGKPILVHPLLFNLKQPYHGPVLDDTAVLNWENDAARWAALGDLRGTWFGDPSCYMH
jgi:hypothetical protein